MVVQRNAMSIDRANMVTAFAEHYPSTFWVPTSWFCFICRSVALKLCARLV